MIGQKNIQRVILQQIENGTFPRFSIITGQVGSGKKMLSKWVASKLHLPIVELGDLKVESIRYMITEAYKIASPTLYLLHNADSMSVAAKNALLKVTEEPPNKAYFIMTLEDSANTLPTILSRGTVFPMDNYSAQEIGDYYTTTYGSGLNEIYLDLCETPGEVDAVKNAGAHAFYDYVVSVVDNIAEVSGAHAFKISDKLSTKLDDGKYPIPLFLKAFMMVCINRLQTSPAPWPVKYSIAIKITSKYLQDFRIKSLNKVATFDCWLLDVRKVWM